MFVVGFGYVLVLVVVFTVVALVLFDPSSTSCFVLTSCTVKGVVVAANGGGYAIKCLIVWLCSLSGRGSLEGTRSDVNDITVFCFRP